MLTDQERSQAIASLQTVYDQIKQYDPVTLFRDLPAEVKKNALVIPLIGPITSSGLEHTYQILNRIDVAIYRLGNPNYETDGRQFFVPDYEIEDEAIEAAAPPPPIAISETTKPEPAVAPPPTPEPTPHTELSFGPFDPRKGNQ